MAEPKRQRPVRCQNQYVYDRLASEKIAQVYRWLVHEEPEGEPTAKVTCAGNEKDRRHLRASIL